MFATKSSARPLISTRTLPGCPGPIGKSNVPVTPTSSAAPTPLETECFVMLRTTVTASAPAAQPMHARTDRRRHRAGAELGECVADTAAKRQEEHPEAQRSEWRPRQAHPGIALVVAAVAMVGVLATEQE